MHQRGNNPAFENAVSFPCFYECESSVVAGGFDGEVGAAAVSCAGGLTTGAATACVAGLSAVAKAVITLLV